MIRAHRSSAGRHDLPGSPVFMTASVRTAQLELRETPLESTHDRPELARREGARARGDLRILSSCDGARDQRVEGLAETGTQRDDGFEADAAQESKNRRPDGTDNWAAPDVAYPADGADKCSQAVRVDESKLGKVEHDPWMAIQAGGGPPEHRGG